MSTNSREGAAYVQVKHRIHPLGNQFNGTRRRDQPCPILKPSKSKKQTAMEIKVNPTLLLLEIVILSALNAKAGVV